MSKTKLVIKSFIKTLWEGIKLVGAFGVALLVAYNITGETVDFFRQYLGEPGANLLGLFMTGLFLFIGFNFDDYYKYYKRKDEIEKILKDE